MSKAKRCDRCGYFYEDLRIQTVKVKRYRSDAEQENDLPLYIRWDTSDLPDLCPTCMVSFQHWFNELSKRQQQQKEIEDWVEDLKKEVNQ